MSGSRPSGSIARSVGLRLLLVGLPRRPRLSVGLRRRNNVYLFGHAHSVFKPLHDAYVRGRLKKGMKVIYADGNGKVSTYAVAWWKVTTPDKGAFAYAAQSRPSLTLQTCVGAKSQYRLIVRLTRSGRAAGRTAAGPLRRRAGPAPAGDDQALDLAGPLPDLGQLGVAHEALHRVVRHVAVAAVDLDRVVGRPRADLRGEQLRLRGHSP